MNNILKKLIYFPLFLIFFTSYIFCQSYEIDYYGIVSKEIDNNMAKMTSDLYYTQLSEIQNFTINDKRTTSCRLSAPDFDSIETDNLIFYSEIIKTADEKWEVSFILIDKVKNEQFSKNKTYDTFYKILLESKNELKNTIKELVKGPPLLKKETVTNNDDKKPAELELIKRISINSPEELSGTWEGEDNIDKIVILRGGRGFVIFEKGASMNISINIQEQDDGQVILIQQKSNSNASFYPELPRKIALDAATSAPPIKWTMLLYDNMIMNGVKTTLEQDNQSYKTVDIPVTWKKIN